VEKEERIFNKDILIGVDESENSRRAVSYVGQFLGESGKVKVTLLHVIPKPVEDFFSDRNAEKKWIENHSRKVDAFLEEYRQILIHWGFGSENIRLRYPVCYCPSVVECILTEREETGCNTIVVGRQGLSQSEEFIFGSISSKLVTHAHHCTVWIVE